MGTQITRLALLWMSLSGTATAGVKALPSVPFEPPWDASHQLQENLSWGLELVNQVGARPRDSESPTEQFAAQELKLGVAARPMPRLQGLATLKWQKTLIKERADRSSELGFESAYVSWLSERGEPLLSLGRYYYEDERGFLFHQTVDGVHGQWHWQGSQRRWQATVFAGHQGRWRQNLLREDKAGPDTDYAFVQLQAQRGKRQLSLYGFSRQGGSAQSDSPLMLGLRSRGPVNDRFDHWLELILARGESGGKDIQAFAMDIGGTWRASSELSWIGGFAYGSGDDSTTTGTDERFRQTGLHLNNGWIGEGGSKLKYYGELTKPELSNITITTLGLRWQPLQDVSLELLLHDYRQPQPDDSFYGYGLKDSPNGRDRDLGQELDLVIGYRRIDGLKLELNLAHFRSGGAFDGATTSLSMAYLELRYRY